MIRRLRESWPYAVLHVAIVTAGVIVAFTTGPVVLALLATLAACLLVHTVAQSRLRVRHVAARQEAETRYQRLVEQLPLITYIDSPYSIDEAAAYVSPQVETILGYSLEEWKSDSSFFADHLHPEDRDRVRELQRESRATGEPLEIEYRFLTKDGRYVWLRDSYVVVRDESGEPWYAQGFALDVTARIEALRDREALLAQAQMQNERLRELDRMKDDFIALVSHELRTPLTSIRGYLELFRDDAGEAGMRIEQQAWLQVIDRNADRLLALVEDLLLSAQAHTGALGLARTEFDAARIVRQCALAGAPAASARGIELRCSADAELPISGDPVRIGQVIDNLVSNALKFTPSGGRVELRAYRRDRFVRIEVADTGMGVPADEAEHLFDRFFRTARAQSEAIAGAGLGLAIAKAIVEAHDGHIGYTTAEGEGTTFTVDLPALDQL